MCPNPHSDTHGAPPEGGASASDPHPVNATWESREQGRLLSGYYKPVPWADKLAPIPGHYVHLSTEQPGLVAYTQDANRGARDVQTVIKPGRYLTRFYPELKSHEIRDLQSAIHRPAQLQFAASADEIERVYLDGPTSCMSRSASSYDGHCHPVRVYGDSDLQLAYVVNDEGKPTARALVWPAKKLRSRIYGDQPLLAQLLEDAGYEAGELAGARIRRIDDGPAVIMPYIDGSQCFDVIDANWLVIGGPYLADATTGRAFLEETATCPHCDECVREGDMSEVDGEYWCDACCDNDSFISDFSEQRFRSDDEREVVVRRRTDGTHIFESWAVIERDENATYCDGSEEHYRTDAFTFVTLDTGETWVDWYFDEHGDPERLVRADSATQEAAADRVAA